MTRTAYLQDDSILDDSRAVYMVRMMTAYEVVRAGVRWVQQCRSSNTTPAGSTEYLVSVLSLASWAHETIKLLKEGWSNNQRLIEKSMLDNNRELIKTWDELKKGNSPRLQCVKRIRNEHVFHFGPSGAEKVLAFVKERGVAEIPFAETGRPGKELETRYPFAYWALRSALSEDDIDPQGDVLNTNAVVSLVVDMRKLVGALLQRFWMKLDVSLREGADTNN